MIALSGVVNVRTKTTASPRPMAVSLLRDRRASIPRKNARAMFSTKIAFSRRLM